MFDGLPLLEQVNNRDVAILLGWTAVRWEGGQFWGIPPTDNLVEVSTLIPEYTSNFDYTYQLVMPFFLEDGWNEISICTNCGEVRANLHSTKGWIFRAEWQLTPAYALVQLFLQYRQKIGQ